MNYRELNNTFKNIETWYKKKAKVLNIKTRPFNTAFIFYDILNKVTYNNGKVLYVVCTKKEDFAHKDNGEYYEQLLGKIIHKNNKENIDFIFIDDLKKVESEYDLIIFDDITSFSQISVEKLRDSVEKIYWKTQKIIIYSCEKVFPIGETLDIIYLLMPMPMIEPRIINTRIKLDEDIPLAVYDYIKWYKDNRKKVIVVVPNEEKLNRVYSCYKETLKRTNLRVIKYSKNDDYKFVKNILKEEKEALVIVTNYLGEYINTVEDINVIILFADDINYNYKKIAYTCGAINVKSNDLSEVLLVSREVSLNMDKAKDIIRQYNKVLWDKRVLR